MKFCLFSYYIILGSVLGLLLFACQNTGQNGASLPKEAMDQLRLASKTPLYERLPQQTTKIKGEGFVKTKGKSLLYVPKGAIMDSAGKTYEGTFEVKVREALTMNDFVQSGLNTLSDKGILESGGMMQILVEDTAGKTLKINPERGLRLSMTVNSPPQPVNTFRKVAHKKEQDTLRKGWQLFYGAKDENGKMIWKETEQPKKVVSVKEYKDIKYYSTFEAIVKSIDALKDFPEANTFKNLDELKGNLFKYDELFSANSSHNRNRPSAWIENELMSIFNNDELPNMPKESYSTSGWLLSPYFICDNRIIVSFRRTEIYFDEIRDNASFYSKFKNKNILSVPVVSEDTTFYYNLFDITNSYNKIKKIYEGLKDDKAFQEKLKAFEKEEGKTARIEAVINQTGWYNCDRYTREERFAGTFEVEGCDPELEPYLRLAWVQPDLNIIIPPTLKQFPNYEFTGVKKSGGVLIAWIPGLMVGSLAVKPEQVQLGQANNSIPVGKIVLQPADDKKINALIEQLSRPVAMADRQRGK